MTAVVTGLGSAVPSAFTQANLDYSALSPLLVVFAGACVGVLVEAFVSRAARLAAQLGVTVVTLLAALVLVITTARTHQGQTAGLSQVGGATLGSLSIDGPALFMQGSLLALAILSVLLMGERLGGVGADAFTPMGAATPGSAQESAATRAGLVTTEVFPLVLFSVGGMMIFVAANDLLMLFVGLEVLSLPLYVMTGLARRRRLLSQEAALKYFLLGSFSSAFLLFGSALLYGYAGSIYLGDIATAISNDDNALRGLLAPGILLVFVGLLFKIGAAPFQAWTPDVYQGAATPVTAFMATCTKLAAFGAILRFVYVGVEADRWDWHLVISLVAILTMVVGAVMSVPQTDIKRILAYSSIAHAGFILVGVLALDKAAVGGVMFYLLCYGFMTVAAFGIVGLVRAAGGSEASSIAQWRGLGRRHPLAAGVFAFLLLAFAGIPLTSGFTAKFAVFMPALRSGGASGTIMVVVGLLCSAITLYVYAKVIVLMFFSSAQDSSGSDAAAVDSVDHAEGGMSGSGALATGAGSATGTLTATAPAHTVTASTVTASTVSASTDPSEGVTVVTPSAVTTVAIVVGTVLTLLLGVAPGAILDLADKASLFIR